MIGPHLNPKKNHYFALHQSPLQMVEVEVTGSILKGYVNWIFIILNSLETRPSYWFILLHCEFIGLFFCIVSLCLSLPG